MYPYLLATSTLPLTGAFVIGGGFMTLMIILIIWTIIWKGLALWKSARQGQKIWFVIMLVVNTVGILEIVYLIINRSKKESFLDKNTPTQ